MKSIGAKLNGQELRVTGAYDSRLIASRGVLIL